MALPTGQSHRISGVTIAGISVDTLWDGRGHDPGIYGVTLVGSPPSRTWDKRRHGFVFRIAHVGFL